ncbi:YeeE/YedE thiosulfate transporter family protein [Planctomycetes bacterium Pla163]
MQSASPPAVPILQRARWSPYAVGAGIGVLSWATFALMDKALGTSTTFVRAAGSAIGAVAPDHVRENAYYAKYLVGKPAFDWQFALVIGLFLGALTAARMARRNDPTYVPIGAVPATWSARFGPSRTRRAVGAFLGGAVLLIGARLAGGCTSGHGISGSLQLAASSLTFIVAAFAVGIPFALWFYASDRGRS